MREDDNALIMNAGVMPTKNNHIFSIGLEMATAFRNNRQENQNSGHTVSLTTVQRRMIERESDLITA
jgi:hypothetical protein